jgi:hypothetical protein
MRGMADGGDHFVAGVDSLGTAHLFRFQARFPFQAVPGQRRCERRLAQLFCCITEERLTEQGEHYCPQPAPAPAGCCRTVLEIAGYQLCARAGREYWINEDLRWCRRGRIELPTSP